MQTYSPTKTLNESYIPHCAPVRVPTIRIRRGRPRVNIPHNPSFFTACIWKKNSVLQDHTLFPINLYDMTPYMYDSFSFFLFYFFSHWTGWSHNVSNVVMQKKYQRRALKIYQIWHLHHQRLPLWNY